MAGTVGLLCLARLVWLRRGVPSKRSALDGLNTFISVCPVVGGGRDTVYASASALFPSVP